MRERSSLSSLNVIRAEAGEATCAPTSPSDTRRIISGFEFFVDPMTDQFTHRSPEGFEIIIEQGTFLTDVEKSLRPLLKIMRYWTPTTIRLGLRHFRADNVAAAYDPEDGRLVFYRDEHGGLLSKALLAARLPETMDGAVRRSLPACNPHIDYAEPWLMGRNAQKSPPTQEAVNA